MIFFVEVLGLIFNKTKWRLWKYIYFWQSFPALKKWKTTEIQKNKNAKNLEILLLTLPDVDDLIKETFYFLTHPTGSAPSRYIYKGQPIVESHWRFNGFIDEGSKWLLPYSNFVKRQSSSCIQEAETQLSVAIGCFNPKHRRWQWWRDSFKCFHVWWWHPVGGIQEE